MREILFLSLLLIAGSVEAMSSAHQQLLDKKQGFQRIRMAVALSETEEVRKLLEEEKASLSLIEYKNKINALEPQETLLYIAAGNGDLEIVKLLIDEGADVNLGNNHVCIPLHAAVTCKNPEVVKLLLEKKANPNACNKNNYTPLHYAVREYAYEAESEYHLSEIIEHLLAYGANPRIVGNAPHFSILDYCDESKGLCEKSEELMALLRKYPNCMNQRVNITRS